MGRRVFKGGSVYAPMDSVAHARLIRNGFRASTPQPVLGALEIQPHLGVSMWCYMRTELVSSLNTYASCKTRVTQTKPEKWLRFQDTDGQDYPLARY